MSSRILRLKTVALIDRGIERLTARDSQAPVARRQFLSVSATSLAAAFLAGCDAAGPRGAERALAYAARKNESVERWLLRHTSMDHGSPGAIVAGNRFPSYFVSDTVPLFDAMRAGPWALEVSGLVQRPARFSLPQLMGLAQQTQRVNHFCVEGWNAVAEFHGVPLRELARAVGVSPDAKIVDFQSFDDGYHESWDIESAMHPQTLIVFGKDGQPLTPAYGAPARVHSPIKLGYKNTKYLTKVVFMAERNGGYWSDKGYEWYGGT